MDNELRAISKLVQERRYDEARGPLQVYLREHPDQATAWYLLSYVEQQPARRLAAIRKAARLNPDRAAIQERLAKLQGGGQRRWPLLALAAVLLIGLIAAALFLLRPPPPARETVPTLVSLDVTQATDIPAAEATAEVTSEPSVPATPLPASTTTTLTSSETPIPPTKLVPTATLTLPAAETEIVVEAAQIKPIFTPAPPTAPGVSSPLPPSATVPPTATTPPTTTAIAPTPLPSPTVSAPGNTVPFGQPGNLGTGTLRVLSSTRAAGSIIAQLGGQAPAPAANQEWVLVEVLLACTNGDNCTPPTSALSILGASGSSYNIPTTLQLDALFSPDGFASGQTWGYAGFLVSTSETALTLLVTQNGQSVAFALQ
jgi:hypothetical protein